MGYSCDFVDETNITSFIPKEKYKSVILYLHEDWTIPFSNKIINEYCKESFLIQHDDTDSIDVQIWSERTPDLVLQRELLYESRTPYPNIPTHGFHFPISSKLDSSIKEKTIDICFLGNMTNQRRLPFIKKIKELSEGNLKRFNWYIDIGDKVGVTTTSKKYIEIINSSKIGLHYFGNSYDSWRIWELASSKCAIIMPKMKNISVSKHGIPFNDYCIIRDDFQDLEEKIEYMLKDDIYKIYAEKAFEDYNNNHAPEKCAEYYHKIIKKYIHI
jgi:hypothetical protein